ncbi:single-strand binding family protein, partial [gut metagenome]
MLKVTVIGNLGADAAVRNINGNDYVCFNLAHEERVKEEKVTIWISVIWYGNGGNF